MPFLEEEAVMPFLEEEAVMPFLEEEAVILLLKRENLLFVYKVIVKIYKISSSNISYQFFIYLSIPGIKNDIKKKK